MKFCPKGICLHVQFWSLISLIHSISKISKPENHILVINYVPKKISTFRVENTLVLASLHVCPLFWSKILEFGDVGFVKAGKPEHLEKKDSQVHVLTYPTAYNDLMLPEVPPLIWLRQYSAYW